MLVSLDFALGTIMICVSFTNVVIIPKVSLVPEVKPSQYGSQVYFNPSYAALLIWFRQDNPDSGETWN